MPNVLQPKHTIAYHATQALQQNTITHGMQHKVKWSEYVMVCKACMQ